MKTLILLKRIYKFWSVLLFAVFMWPVTIWMLAQAGWWQATPHFLIACLYTLFPLWRYKVEQEQKQ